MESVTIVSTVLQFCLTLIFISAHKRSTAHALLAFRHRHPNLTFLYGSSCPFISAGFGTIPITYFLLGGKKLSTNFLLNNPLAIKSTRLGLQ